MVTPYPCDQNNKCMRNTSVCWVRLNILSYVGSLRKVCLNENTAKSLLLSHCPPQFFSPFSLSIHSPTATVKWGKWEIIKPLMTSEWMELKLQNQGGEMEWNGTIFQNSYLLLGFHLMLKKKRCRTHHTSSLILLVTNTLVIYLAETTSKTRSSHLQNPRFSPPCQISFLWDLCQSSKKVELQCSNRIQWVSKTGVHSQQNQKQKTVSCLFGNISPEGQLYST